ncbi:Disease resistance protein RGA2 [Rhynchospora pubera]|uniref:Disease resistance protein RGA2 n=1 Tax=Rhynchospora pubera TaxID=906938 RepID=A0AAV8GFF8_9POAL|nr:Disease resistance protein RGA2 [Rhynchospora pubera]
MLSQHQSRKQVLVKLENLQIFLHPKLLILIEAAQLSPHRHVLEPWIKKLKLASKEAENVLASVESSKHETEEEVDSHSPYSELLNFKLPKDSSDKKNLMKSLENLEDIVNEAMTFVGLLNLPSSRNPKPTQFRETISSPSSKVIGRDKDRDDIVKLLREDITTGSSSYICNSYSVIGIWGPGGSGKTTLAQYVCEYEKSLQEKYFNLVIWAYFSPDFDIYDLWKKIWGFAFKEACPDFIYLEEIQSKLEEQLRGKRILLVLDNAWYDKRVSVLNVQQLFIPLRSAKSGSKILVTTRMEEAAKRFGATNPIPMQELDEEQFLSLFMHHALGYADAHTCNNHVVEMLTSIGKEIASMLCRSPLVATTVAMELRIRPDPNFWLSMLDKVLKGTLDSLQCLEDCLDKFFIPQP